MASKDGRRKPETRNMAHKKRRAWKQAREMKRYAVVSGLPRMEAHR